MLYGNRQRRIVRQIKIYRSLTTIVNDLLVDDDRQSARGRRGGLKERATGNVSDDNPYATYAVTAIQLYIPNKNETDHAKSLKDII